MIHVFGDSHCWAFKEIPGAWVIEIGSITAHRIGRDGFGSVSGHNLMAGSLAIFVFGEIDCRCHIPRFAAQSSFEAVATDVAARYAAAIRRHCDWHQVEGVLSCVLPASDIGHTSFLPVAGSLQERVEATRCLNRSLERESAVHGLHFLDFHSAFALDDGSLDHSKSDGLVHVADSHRWIVTEAWKRKFSP